MKKFIIGLFAILNAAALSALPIGNPWDASLLCDGIYWEGDCCRDPCDSGLSLYDSWSVRVGFYGDYVFNRNLKADSNSRGTIHDTEIFTNAGYIAFNMWDRFDVFWTVGATHIDILSRNNVFGGANNENFLIETDTDFSWSVGIRGTIWECGCLGIGAEAQYFSTHPDINQTKEENTGPEYPSNLQVKYREWQIGLGAAYRINIAACRSTALIPYAGIKWSRARVDLGNAIFFNEPAEDLESDRHFGYAIGLTLVGCNKGSVTLEGRFVDEKAVHVNAQVRF